MSEVLQNPVTNQLLGVVAAGLLVFVSVAVIYLSAVEWSDRRRRKNHSEK
ncbi:MAG: hypothetical protein AB8A46_00015 [Prochlorococcus sp.]